MNGSSWVAKYMRGVVIDEVVNGFQNNTSGVWTNYTFHHDNLQSVLGLSGHEGSVLQAISYGPFGEKISTAGAVNNNYLHFTGREEDTDSGLYYFRARYYDPGVGRFITEDPKGFDAGVNFYAYASNNPINRNDPLGLFDKSFLSVNDKLYGRTDKFVSPSGMYVVDGHGNPQGVYTGNNYEDRLSAQQYYDSIKPGLQQKDYVGLIVGVHCDSYDFAKQVAVLANNDGYSFAVPNGTARIYSVNGIDKGIVSTGPTTNGYAPITNWTLFAPNKPEDRNAANPISTLYSNDTSTNSTVPSFGSSIKINQQSGYADLSSNFDSYANGGFVIYPNKANTNMMRSVYAK